MGSFLLGLLVLQTKAVQSNFRVFEELVFFDLYISDSEVRTPESGLDYGFRIQDSGLEIRNLDSGFLVLERPPNFIYPDKGFVRLL